MQSLNPQEIPLMDKSFQPFLITPNFSIKDAMRRIGRTGERILFVVNEKNQLLGSLTDGDIRRWVLGEGELTSTIENACNKEPIFFVEVYDLEKVKQIMLNSKIDGIPVLNKEREIKELLLWSRVFGQAESGSKGKIDIPVVIMAGGKGTRLDPFTRILPKPLIPIGDKAIIEYIMDKFNRFGVNEFHVTVNHKSHMIKAYFEDINTAYRINYIDEEKPLGTAGSLKYLEGKVKSHILVSNCDIIIDADYTDIIDFHENNHYDITIVGSFRHFTIPYGICMIENGGNLVSIKEKPEYDYLVNTGMYVLKGELLKLIPKNKFFNITDLVNLALEQKSKIGVFPIDEKSWTDVGQWEEYNKTVQNLKVK